MKTSLEKRLENASARMKANARSAFKHPFSSILSLCMIASIAATIASFSQTGEPPVPSVEVAPAKNTMPVARTITDTKGRSIEGTIFATSDTAITFQREGGTKFEIKIDTLSADDVAFISTLVRKPLRILTIGIGSEDAVIIKKHGCEITRLNGNSDKKPDLGEISDEQLLEFDIIFQGYYPSNQHSRLLAVLEQFQGVALVHDYRPSINRQIFLSGKNTKDGKYGDEHFHTDENFVFFNGSPRFEEAVKTAVGLAEKNRLTRSSNPRPKPDITKKLGSKTKRVLYIMDHALMHDRHIMLNLENDGYDLTIAWDNEAKPLSQIVKGAKYSTSFPVPSKRQFMRPEEATAKGFDALCVGTTTILKNNRERMTWSKKYIDLMREADELGLVVMVNSLDEYSKKRILSGSPKTVGDITTTEFLKMDGNFIIYNRQIPVYLRENPDDPTGGGTTDKDEKRRRIFNQKLQE